ncbi:MAG: SpoIID/LytB domain-containing protein [Bacillota bacterium]
MQSIETKVSLRILTMILLSVILVCLATGCTTEGLRKPVPRPDIPEEISRGPGKEPRIKVFVTETKTIQEMPLEEYVMNTVAGEMKNWFPPEALAAQAILARTYTLRFVEIKKHSDLNPSAHISTSFEEAQAWNPDNVNNRVRSAVQATQGKVVVYGGRYINAWFHSHAGGLTATAKEGLNYEYPEPPYTQVVRSGEGPTAPKEFNRWRAVFTKQEVVRAFQKIGTQPGDFSSITVSQRGPSGRAVRIRAGSAEVHAADLRTALGSTEMKSTMLTSARVEGDKVILEGKGFGHGVGMSQWGALEMARRGKNAEEIIRHYFKNVDIVKLW